MMVYTLVSIFVIAGHEQPIRTDRTSRLEFLDLRSHVWGIRECFTLSIYALSSLIRYLIEQDLHSLSKKEGTSVRVV
jgi:hypothetical protein